MRRFRFSLERVLDLRRYKERECELELAKITGECRLIQQEIQNRTDELARIRHSGSRDGVKIDIQNRVAGELFMLRLQKEQEQLGDELALKEIKRQEAQDKYIAASRERKVIDKLKEKRATEYTQMMNKEEIKQVDDMNNSRYRRE